MAILYSKEHKDPVYETPDTATIKAALLKHYRFKRQALACTEFDYADLFVIFPKNKTMIEIEVKVSISDLKADFKKGHRLDLIALEKGETERLRDIKTRNGIKSVSYPAYPPIVDMLYYAFPESLLEKAQPIVESYIPYAGLITIGDCRLFENGDKYQRPPVVVKRAKKLKCTKEDRSYEKTLEQMSYRMSSEIANMHSRKVGINAF